MPTSVVDVAGVDVDYLAFSFHKVLAPFGVGVLYARESLLERSLPFLYGGDMIAEGKVSPATWSTTSSPGSSLPAPRTCSEYRLRPSAPAAVDLALDPAQPWFGDPDRSPGRRASAMSLVHRHVRDLTDTRSSVRVGSQESGSTGPARASRGRRCWPSPSAPGPPRDRDALDHRGIEARAGCHCATLAHLDLGLTASSRLSFAAYTSTDDVERALDALERVVRQPRSFTSLSAGSST